MLTLYHCHLFMTNIFSLKKTFNNLLNGLLIDGCVVVEGEEGGG